mgnify:CR=1 FL=1
MDKGMPFFDDLQGEFQSTVIQELLPGILHNFANPLNGIMGRSKLLQKRAGEALGSGEQCSGGPNPETREKILRDVDLIAEQGDRLYELFAQVAGKIHRLHDRRKTAINLSELLAAEVGFFDFYLDFKHSIEKNVNINMEIPTVMGTPADFSLALFSILRHSMSAMKDSPVRILSIFTDFDPQYVSVLISDSGVHDDGTASVFESFQNDFSKGVPEMGNGCRGLYNALELLKKYDARCSFEIQGGINKITLSLPHGNR